MNTLGHTLGLIVPPDFREQHWRGFRAAMVRHSRRLDGAAQHMPVLCSDGTVRVYPERLLFLRDPHGYSVGATVTDSTCCSNLVGDR